MRSVVVFFLVRNTRTGSGLEELLVEKNALASFCIFFRCLWFGFSIFVDFIFFTFVGEESRVLFLGRSMLSLLPSRGFFGGEERLWFLALNFRGFFFTYLQE